MYRYKVIDIHSEDPWFEKIQVGQVLESHHKADINERSPICRDTLRGFTRAYIGGRHFFAIKVEDITEHEVEPAPWIPVSERLPEFDESVLVFCRIYGRFLATYVHIGDFDGQKYGNWRDFKGQLGILPPTHWMPLPEPPQK